MQKQRKGHTQNVMEVLWNELLVLWCDSTRRRALPLLLASLLLLMPSLSAHADCCCEPDDHHHEVTHHTHEAHHQAHSRAVASSTTHPGHSVANGRSVVSGSGIATCSCPRAPLSTPTFAALPNLHSNSHILITVDAPTFSAGHIDILGGRFGRAGPAPNGKPPLIFLASLSGRAPPVSL